MEEILQHIVQSNSKTDGVYIVVNSEGFEGELPQHPAIRQHPELFEIVEGSEPENKIVNHLNYTPEVPEE